VKCWLLQRQWLEDCVRSSDLRIIHWRSDGIRRSQQHRIDWLVVEWMRQVMWTPPQLETFSLEPGTRLPCGLLDNRSLPATTLPVSAVQVRRSKVCSATLFLLHDDVNYDKKAVLSQRWPRNAPYIWVPWKFSGLPDYVHGHYSQYFHGLLFRSTLWMFLQNLKSVVLPVAEIIGGTQKIWAVPGCAHAPFSENF